MKKYIILIILSLGYWGGIHAQTPQKMTYVYDALNRLTEVTYPNGSKITYNYDVLGNRTSVVTVGATPTCAVPTGMQWQNTTATSFQPRCDGVAGYSYVFHYRASGTTTWTETTAIPCTTTGVGTVETIFTGLTNGITYEWQVKTVCSVGNESAYSASTFSSTFCQPANLNAPSGSQITSTTAYLAWNNFGIPLNVNLRWRVVGATLWNTANNLSGTNNTLTGLLPSSNYEVQIQTICADGSLSAFSTSRTFTTLCALPTATLTGTQTITTGQTANLSVALTGVAPWSIVMSGATYTASVSPFSIAVSPSTTTTYSLTSVSNSCGAGTVSGSAVVTVNACTSLYTLKTGNWNDITVWSCGRLPVPTDIVTIKAGHLITIPATYTANAKSVIFEAGGKIIEASNTSKLCLNCSSTIPTNGLVLYLPLDGNANDASGNNNHGVVTGATLGNDRFGVANKAYRFNDGNRITVTNSTSLSLTNAFAVSMWVNMQSTTGRDGWGSLNTYGYHSLFTKNCDRGQLQAGIIPSTDGTFQFIASVGSSGNSPVIPFSLNQWKHLGIVYDGSNLKHFVNGTEVSSIATTMNLSLTNSNDLFIGYMGCFNYFFNGFIDEFRMYNRGLSNSEVNTIYTAEKP